MVQNNLHQLQESHTRLDNTGAGLVCKKRCVFSVSEDRLGIDRILVFERLALKFCHQTTLTTLHQLQRGIGRIC